VSFWGRKPKAFLVYLPVPFCLIFCLLFFNIVANGSFALSQDKCELLEFVTEGRGQLSNQDE
jgi:hypothetical protein